MPDKTYDVHGVQMTPEEMRRFIDVQHELLVRESNRADQYRKAISSKEETKLVFHRTNNAWLDRVRRVFAN